MRKIWKLSILVIALILSPTTALAWSPTVHMVVAQIAFENLNKQARERVNQLARRVQLAEMNYEFVTVACWMDDIKGFPMFEPMREWHYINRRFIVSGSVPDVPPPPVNVQSIIEWSIQELSKRKSKEKEKENVKAYTLAYLIHLMGDVHQPLHCATRYTEKHPDGDGGGNSFYLTNDAPRSNLHSYWDAAGGLFGLFNSDDDEVKRPLTDSDRQRIRQFARDVMTSYPANALQNLDDLQPSTWVGESHQLAKSDAYQNIEEKGTPDNTYASNTQTVCSKRIAMAGYRLAKVLNKLFGQQ